MTMKFPLLMLTIFYSCILNAQTPSAYENAAESAVKSRDYYSAMQYYGKVLEMEPQRLEVSFQYADAAREYGAYRQAETYYEKTVAEDYLGKFPEATFRLATTKKSLGKYDEAIDLYQRYIASDKVSSQFRELAKQDMEQCEWALEKLTVPDESMVVQRLSDEINTNESDFGATMFNGKMYYSSFRMEKWGDKNYPARPISKIMESIEGQTGQNAPFLNSEKKHTAHSAFSLDGNVIVFNYCEYTGITSVGCELYFSGKQSNGQWSAPVKLPATINAPDATVSQPNVSITHDGYYELYFSSNAEGGKGGLDIWKAKFSAAGNFGKPENLSINTEQDDATPFFDASSQTLYFSTKGLLTLGGYDIYKVNTEKGLFKSPEHLSFPLNSSYDDLYFAPQDKGEWAYFSSNRSGSNLLDESVCCYDIYQLNWKPINLDASAFSLLSEEPLDKVTFTVTIVEEDDDEKGKEESRFSQEKNNAAFPLARAKKYRVIAQKENYLPDTTYVTTYIYPTDGQLKSKLYLVPKIDLLVNTFHQWSKDPLMDVRIRLYELPNVIADEKETGEKGNQTSHQVGGKRKFSIIAEKEGFISDTLLVSEEEFRDLVAGSTLKRNVFLAPAFMSAYLPIVLFFDNDQPDARSRANTTLLSYDQTLDRYRARKDLFIETYTKSLEGEAKEKAVAQLTNFFDEDLKNGQTKLETFASNLDLFLQNGSALEIMVKAFASPLAKPEYNMALTNRRIASVRNYLRKYGNGIFEQYLRNGQLKVSMLPLGETESSKTVSDSSKDKRSSIFSIEASIERRAEILEVKLFKN